MRGGSEEKIVWLSQIPCSVVSVFVCLIVLSAGCVADVSGRRWRLVFSCFRRELLKSDCGVPPCVLDKFGIVGFVVRNTCFLQS